ncbi:MAG TPA: hypothetical protein VGG04_07230 [Candidatus Sulfotelmatobacter sp.]
MSVSILRYVMCWAMIGLVPPTLLAQGVSNQGGGAILHAQGGVWVNGAEARDSLAILPGDLIETKTGFSANLSLDGSTVLIGPESIAKFGSDYIELDHGKVLVGTSKIYKVYVNCIRVVPVLPEWTNYEVTDVSRSIDVAAHKDDVNVEHDMAHKKASDASGKDRASVHEGEQHSYDETGICGAPDVAKAGGLNSKLLAGGGVGGGALILCALLCGFSSGGGKKEQVSPSTP